MVFPLCDPNVSVRRIEASFRKRGNSLSGNPCLASLGPVCGFVSWFLCSQFLSVICCLFFCSRFLFLVGFSSCPTFTGACLFRFRAWFVNILRGGPTNGRMFGPAKGMSSTTLPYKRRAPSWIKLKPEDLSEQFYKLARKGITPSSIGVTLGDSFGVAQLKMFTTIKFLRILKKKGLAPFIPEDLYFLVENDVSMQLSIEEPVEPDCTKYGVSSTKAVFRLGIRELVWKWLDMLSIGTSRVYPPVSGSQSAELRVRVLVPPGALLCFLHEWLLSFELDTLTRLSAGLLTNCIAPARRPVWSVRCIRVATGCSRILTPGERPVLERLRPCTAPRQFLLERAILCETCLSQCLEARRVG